MITISHTHAEGTLIEGTQRGDGSAEAVKSAGFRWSRSLGQWYLPHSRDQLAKSWKIGAARTALEAAGFEVAVTVDETQRRDFAEAEAERYENAEARAERMAGYAANAAARSESAHSRSDAISDGIPFGQPILVGHHSERRHRRDLDRMHSLMGRSIAEADKAGHFAQRAETAANAQAKRESIPTTLRRIEKLEADARRVQRGLAGRTDYVSDGNGGHELKLIKPEGAYLERLNVRAADLAEQIACWRGVVARREAEDGVKIWSRDDFAKGDYVRFGGFGTWYEVLRVSAKSVTIPAMINDGPIVTKANGRCTWTDTIPYHKVTGRKSAEDMAAIVAEADRRMAEPATA